MQEIHHVQELNDAGPYTLKKRILTVDLIREPRPWTRPKVTGPSDSIPLLRAIFATMDTDKEHVVALYFDQANKLIGYKHISTGCLDSSTLHPREVYQMAVI